MATRTKNIWSYSSGLDMQQSCVGYDVHAVDGDIGTIDEETIEAGRMALVVDTGGWIFGKKRMIPAACIGSVDHANRRVNVALTKEQIKQAPDAKDRLSRDDNYYEVHSGYYQPFA